MPKIHINILGRYACNVNHKPNYLVSLSFFVLLSNDRCGNCMRLSIKNIVKKFAVGYNGNQLT